MVDKLTDNITLTKDLSHVQDQSQKAGYGGRKGRIVAEVAVAAIMAQQGVAALAVGTYDLVDGNGDVIQLPDNAILTKPPIADCHEIAAGAGTLKVELGGVAFDEDFANTSTIEDDGAGNVFVAGYKATAAADFTVVVTVDTVTAGACTFIIEYLLGNDQ